MHIQDRYMNINPALCNPQEEQQQIPIFESLGFNMPEFQLEANTLMLLYKRLLSCVIWSLVKSCLIRNRTTSFLYVYLAMNPYTFVPNIVVHITHKNGVGTTYEFK